MSNLGFLERWMKLGANGTAVANTTSQLTLLGGVTGETPTVPPRYFKNPGDGLMLKLGGRVSTVVTTPGTLNIVVFFDAIAVWDSGAIPLNIVAKTNVPWLIEIDDLHAVTYGSGTIATLEGIGKITSEAVIGSPLPSVGGNGVLTLPYNTAPAPGAGFDSTVSHLVDVQAKFSVANSSNSIRLETALMGLWN